VVKSIHRIFFIHDPSIERIARKIQADELQIFFDPLTSPAPVLLGGSVTGKEGKQSREQCP